MGACQGELDEVRGQPEGVGFLLPPCLFPRLMADFLPAELSHSHKCFELEMDYQLAMPRALGYLIINYTIVKK